jgi:threonine dehydratase
LKPASPIGPAEIEDAARRIAGRVRHTPVIDLGHVLPGGFTLAMKLEHLQVTGSFKPRGAFSKLIASDVPAAGVVAASGGNFGLAVAHAAAELGHVATIFVPETSPAEKIDRIGAWGAVVRRVPGFYESALASAEAFAAETGALTAHAYDDALVMAGQGTLGRELETDLSADVVLVAVGGGGLIGGVASWYRDRAAVVAVEPASCPSLHASLAAGHPVQVEVGGVAASSLGAHTVGEHPWAARRWIDDSVLVGEDDIVAAQRWIWGETRQVVEPAAATTIAALLSGEFRPEPGMGVVAVISGGNVDPASVT